MELHTGKLTKLFVYLLLAAAAFSVAAPLALMILNSLRNNFDILISPLGLAERARVGRLRTRLEGGPARPGDHQQPVDRRGDRDHRLHHLVDGRLGDRPPRGAGLDDGQPLFPGDHDRADPDVHVPAVLHDGEARADQQPGRGDHHLLGDLHAVLSLFLLRTYVLDVPIELEEAARIDGASDLQVFIKVIVPLISPGLLTVALIVCLNVWNEFPDRHHLPAERRRGDRDGALLPADGPLREQPRRPDGGGDDHRTADPGLLRPGATAVHRRRVCRRGEGLGYSNFRFASLATFDQTATA